jgi:hypothetical protein
VDCAVATTLRRVIGPIDASPPYRRAIGPQANHWPRPFAEIARMLASVSTHRSSSRTCDMLTSLFVWDHALRAMHGGAAEE